MKKKKELIKLLKTPKSSKDSFLLFYFFSYRSTLFVYKRSKSRIFVDEKKPKIAKSTKTEKLNRKKSIEKPLITNCPFCQAELPGNQKFCVYCGAKLEE
jgi:hypothetical protein